MTTTVNRNHATDFQFDVFAQLVADDGAGRGLSAALKKKLGNLPPHLMMILMQTLQDGALDLAGDDASSARRLAREGGMNASDLQSLHSTFQEFLGDWRVDDGAVERFIATLGFGDVDASKRAELAKMLMDGALDSAEADRMSALGLIDEDDITGMQQAANYIIADGNTPVSKVGLEGMKTLRDIGVARTFSFGDTMLFILILMMQLFQKRIEEMSGDIATVQTGADAAAHKYRQHLDLAPADKTSDAYKTWSEDKEALRLDMDQTDDEVEQMIAEMKRTVDKYDTLEKMLQGILDQIGQMERAMAQGMNQ